MKPRTLIVLMVLFLGSTAQASAKVSMAVSRREETAFVPLNYQETRVELARIYNTGDAPLELSLTWTQTGGNLEGVLAPDALILEPNETRLCFLVFNASAMGGISGIMEVMAVQEELVMNVSGAGGTVVPAFEVRKSVTVAESPILAVETTGASPSWSLAINNVGRGASDDLLVWRVEAPEWLSLSKNNGFGPATVEVALSPRVVPGTYEGALIIESNVGSEQIPVAVVVEEPVDVEEPEPVEPDPEENTTVYVNVTVPGGNQEPEEPEPKSVNWAPGLMVGLLVGVAFVLKRKGGTDETGDEENEVLTEPSAFTELRRRMRAEK